MNQLLLDDFSTQANFHPGAERIELFLSRLEGKNIGIVANHTAMLGKTHLVDSLAALENERIRIARLFGPEHGFRGKGEDALPIEDEKDHKTGIPIISLYGRKHKPTAKDLAELDLLLFDIQDVGIRFYTYISTLYYVMQACAESNLELLLLDRPNPNGFYVDGPVLEPGFSSFLGLHEVPLVYGKENFYTPFFEKLAGTASLRHQIIDGLSEEEIRTSWAENLASFKKIRQKYLIYP